MLNIGAGFTVIVKFPDVPDCGPVLPALESVTLYVNVTLPAVVGVPVIAPVLLLMESPSESPVALQVSVPAPPETVRVKVYAWPTVATGSWACVVVVVGRPVTVMVTLFDMFLSFTDVAVITAVPVAPLAVNVTEVTVTPPRAVHAAPAQLHVTPWLVPSFVSVTLIVTCWP